MDSHKPPQCKVSTRRTRAKTRKPASPGGSADSIKESPPTPEAKKSGVKVSTVEGVKVPWPAATQQGVDVFFKGVKDQAK